ncbi:MAG: hypothetical protein LBF85_03020 [Tannerella sp.]|jgi:hypothetical protein|nr:hypothetical protein [Tannerella sp.]
MDKFIFYMQQFFGHPGMAWFVLTLSVILLVIRLRRKKGEVLRGTTYIVSNTLFLVTCAIEILHVATADSPIWFCTPDRVGWLWAIINFVLLGGIVYNQALYFMDVMSDVFANGDTLCDYRLGIYSYLGGLALLMLFAAFFPAFAFIVIILLAIMQIVQLVMFFRSYGANVKGAFFCSFVYLLGSIGTLVVTMTFVSILIIIILALALLWLILKITGIGSNKPLGKAKIHYSDGTSEEADETGRGVLGERYYRGKDSGDEFVKP